VNWLKRLFSRKPAVSTELARNVEYVDGQLMDEVDPELIRTMQELAKRDSAEARHRLLKLLKSTTLLVLSPDASADPGPKRIERGETVNLAISENADGQEYVPAFTSPGLLYHYLQSTPLGYFPIDAIALMEMLEGSQTDIVLDYGSNHAVKVKSQEFEELLRYL
jgi:SseB protein N-terminal domain